MLVFDLTDPEGLPQKGRLDDLQLQYLRTLFHETVDGAVREAHHNAICVLRSEGVSVLLGRPLEDREAVARHVLKRCKERLKSLPVHAGLGEPCESPDELARSCREAASALRIGRRLRTAKNIDGRIHAFAALGVQRLLFALSQESAEALQEFKERALGPVIDYDAEHGTQLLETLRAYIQCDGNAQGVAQRLHVHKHTVRYRLRRITELTGLDVTKLQDATQLYLAVGANDLL